MEYTLNVNDIFKTGLFILNSNKTAYVPFTENSEIYLTQENNTALKNEILKLIADTKEVIKICTFILTDKEIFKALLARAKENDIAIFVLTQLDPSKLQNTSISELITEEELKENPVNEHLFHIKMLYDHGAHVRAATTAHAKFIIADREKAMIMSANLTSPSLNFNTESGVYLDTNTVAELDRLFDVIFQHGTKYRQYHTASKSKTFVVQTAETISPQYLQIEPSSKLLYTYEHHSRRLYYSILDIIQSAVEYIYLSSYSIVALHHLPEFVDEIKKARARNVDIYIFCRGMNYRSDHLKSCLELDGLGCRIYGDVYNHSKGIVNEKTGLIFTANIDGNHGLLNGFEVGYHLDETQRKTFLLFHKDLLRTSPYCFVNEPTRKVFFETYSIYEAVKRISPPTFAPDLLLNSVAGLSINPDDFVKYPIFYAKKGRDSYLFAGSKMYKCSLIAEQFTLLSSEDLRYDLEKFLLKYNNLKINLN